MEFKESNNFQQFHHHVFGDYRYYSHNGLSEDDCECLEGFERIKAEKLVIQSIRKIIMDERAIRAAGYLKLQTAVPILGRRLKSIFIRQRIRSSIVWALLKIKCDNAYLEKIINVVNNGPGLDGLTRPDAVNLLSDFGKEPSALSTLLHAFLDKDIFVSASALYALRRVFRDNGEVSYLLRATSFASPFYERVSMVKKLESSIGS